MSERVEVATPEQRIDDIRAVMDAAGSERAAVMGVSEGGTVSALFAATYPDRVSSLILYASAVAGLPDDDSLGRPHDRSTRTISAKLRRRGLTCRGSTRCRRALPGTSGTASGELVCFVTARRQPR
jgi:pimeloyl-ACP methyl ester carboxylesterase